MNCDSRSSNAYILSVIPPTSDPHSTIPYLNVQASTSKHFLQYPRFRIMILFVDEKLTISPEISCMAQDLPLGILRKASTTSQHKVQTTIQHKVLVIHIL